MHSEGFMQTIIVLVSVWVYDKQQKCYHHNIQLQLASHRIQERYRNVNQVMTIAWYGVRVLEAC